MKSKIPIFLLLVCLIAIPSVVADSDVDIGVYTEGDLDLSINGTADSLNYTIVLNGHDLIEEQHALEEQLEKEHDGDTAFMTYVYYQGLYESLETRHDELVQELNGILGDLYNKVGFAYHAIGLLSNSTDVVVGLQSGNVTVAGYLEETLVKIEDVETEIASVEKEIADVLVVVRALSDSTDAKFVQFEMAMGEGFQEVYSYYDAELAERDTKISMLETELVRLDGDLQGSKAMTANVMYMFLGSFIVLLIAIVATRNPKIVVAPAK